MTIVQLSSPNKALTTYSNSRRFRLDTLYQHMLETDKAVSPCRDIHLLLFIALVFATTFLTDTAYSQHSAPVLPVEQYRTKVDNN